MKVLVDTCIWSHALRSKKPEFETQVKSLEGLIADQRVLVIGAIRQEVLSGYSDMNKFEALKVKLSHFDNTPILDEDYIIAAKFGHPDAGTIKIDASWLTADIICTENSSITNP